MLLAIPNDGGSVDEDDDTSLGAPCHLITCVISIYKTMHGDRIASWVGHVIRDRFGRIPVEIMPIVFGKTILKCLDDEGQMLMSVSLFV